MLRAAFVSNNIIFHSIQWLCGSRKKKCKKPLDQRNETELTATTKSQDIQLSSNAAYETVDVHYEDPRYRTRQPVETEEYNIYEQPALWGQQLYLYILSNKNMSVYILVF